MGGPTPARKKKSVKHDPLYKVGYGEGRKDMRQEVLTFLQEKYMHPSVTRESVEAKAILKVAEELSGHLQIGG